MVAGSLRIRNHSQWGNGRENPNAYGPSVDVIFMNNYLRENGVEREASTPEC